jgi:hypothetical protein
MLSMSKQVSARTTDLDGAVTRDGDDVCRRVETAAIGHPASLSTRRITMTPQLPTPATQHVSDPAPVTSDGRDLSSRPGGAL